MRTLIREMPLEPEIPLPPRLGVFRDEGHEERAVADLPSDLLIPGIASAQLRLVEPHIDAGGTQPLANASRCLGILRGIAQKHGFRRLTYQRLIIHRHPLREPSEGGSRASA